MAVRWTDGDEAELQPGRGVGTAPTPPKRPPTPKSLLKAAAKSCLKYRKSWEGRTSGDADALEALPQLIAWFEAADAKAAIASDARLQGLAYRMFTQRGWDKKKPSITPKLTRFWMRNGGAAFAIEALAEAYSWNGASRADFASRAIGDLDQKDGNNRVALDDLRRQLAMVSDEEYAAAVTVARDIYDRAGLSFQTALAYLFPTEADFAARAAEAYLASETDEILDCAQLVATGLRDPELAAKLAMRVRWGASDVLAAGVRNNGDAMGPQLLWLYEMCRHYGTENKYRPGVAWNCLEAMCRIGSDEVADVMLDRLLANDKYEQKYVPPFFLAWPKLAIPRLEAAEGDVAADMLARVRKAFPDLDPNAAEQADASDVPVALKVSRDPVELHWYDPSLLPGLKLRDADVAVPPDAVKHFVELLQQVDGKRTAELDETLAALDPDDVAAIGLALFRGWVDARISSSPKWIPRQLAFTMNDAAARAVGTEVKSWSGSYYNQGINCVKALAASGSETALLQIGLLSQKSRSKGLRKVAVATLGQVARERGLTSSQLADRLVPTFGLDAAGSMVLDFGPRSFTVGFDEKLVPYVVDDTGKRRKSLPKPGVKDDADKGAAATTAWKGLKKDVRAIASTQIARFEQAMVGQQRWSAADFQRFVVGHPLVVHIARRLVWGVYVDGALVGTFRVDESGGFADIEDEAVSLDGSIGVVHRLELDDAQAAAWGERLGEYELIQPFEQLSRPIFEPAGVDAVVKRLDGAVVPQGRIRRLIDRGWKRGAVVDNGYFYDVAIKEDGVTASFTFEQGLNVSGQFGDAEVTLSALVCSGARSVRLSEVGRQLSGLDA